ncbi:hypothetical protein CF645_38490 [Burkholderia pseudomallei]|nr:hypothetical protein CF645_38490 [Burkholderia pseudomallei]
MTGQVYNALHMPPWPLPENATQSGFMTRSPAGERVMKPLCVAFSGNGHGGMCSALYTCPVTSGRHGSPSGS